MPQPQVAFTEILGQVIRKRRQAVERTQDNFAPMIAVSPSALSRIESGHIPLSVVQLRRIGEVLKVPASELLQEAESLEAKIHGASPGVRVVGERPKADSTAAAGWFLGGAAIGALVASILNEESSGKSKSRVKRR